jgi:DGQHR domain-containing protein
MIENRPTIKINNVIEVEQPLGTFLVAKMKASELLKISYRDERTFNKDLSRYTGTQRSLKPSKLKSIKEFIETRDATFPNTIIGTLSDASLYDYTNGVLEIVVSDDIDEKAFQVIDGQHRLWAFQDSPVAEDFDLLVSFFLNADVEDQAYIFSIINTTQTKLEPSLVSDLTELSKITTPENCVHSIAKVFNNRINSPWRNSIKMLGKKDITSSNGIISQYSFNKSILRYIYNSNNSTAIRNILIDSKNNRLKLESIKINIEEFIFWNYYKNSEEEKIYKILEAYFNSLKDVFPNKWCNPTSILCKTSGYDAFMRLFRDFYNYCNGDFNTLINKDFYMNIMLKNLQNVDIDADSNKLGAAGAASLYKMLKNEFPTK